MAAIKFGSHLKELRILLCQTSKSSQGVRDFVEKEYVKIKQNNPAFPVLIRECSMIEPKIYARYAYGVERNISLNNLKSGEVLNCIERLASLIINISTFREVVYAGVIAGIRMENSMTAEGYIGLYNQLIAEQD